MTIDKFISLLPGPVRRNSRSVTARCPAHPDRTPSLTVREGEKGILVKCFAGCTLAEIAGSLGLRIKDLFFDVQLNPVTVAEARRRREGLERQERMDGACSDSVREARAVIQHARGINIDQWSPEQLAQALAAIATARDILRAGGEIGYDDFGL